jgi:diguanylate cyclase (GGDEF)-like protein
MAENISLTGRVFLSTMPADRNQRRLALAVVLVATVLFVAGAPFAKVKLQPVAAFIPMYEMAVIIIDLITAVLLYGQFAILRSRALLVLASGYLFTSTMTVAHVLSFPGLFSPTGFLGAGPQTTLWLYVFWHLGFALFVIGYALLKDDKPEPYTPHRSAYVGILSSVALVLLTTVSLTFLTTAGHDALPAIMNGNNYGPGSYLLALAGWPIALLALAVLLRRGPHSVLDLWVVVVMCVQVLEVAMSATLNGGRFDLGFYFGRVYGVLAASFVLLVLLVENGRLYARLVAGQNELERLSTADPLTAIANRRAFDDALDAEWRRALRSRTPLALLLVDVDCFKPFNDTYGHVAGDQCLRAIAKVLASGGRRAGETIARYGGDEFAILLPGTDLAKASVLARRLRDEVVALALPNENSTVAAQVTISIGVAALLVTAETNRLLPGPTLLVEAADRALYAAKLAGRNQVAEHAGDPVAAGSDRLRAGVASAAAASLLMQPKGQAT